MTLQQILDSLAACLCAELTPDGEPGPGLCFCGVLPGDVIVADVGENCDDACGMAWVRVDSMYPATSVGVVATEDNTCGQYLGIDVELGVLRCIDGGNNGQPPEAEVLEAAGVQQIQDALAMRRAIKCCDALDDIDYLLGFYSPSGPGGLVVGGTWAISLLVP